jgi:hypothetical protein
MIAAAILLMPHPHMPQPQHLRDIVRRLHHIPRWIPNPRHVSSASFGFHPRSPQLAEEGAIPAGAEEGEQFSMAHDSHACKHKWLAPAKPSAAVARFELAGEEVADE